MCIISFCCIFFYCIHSLFFFWSRKDQIGKVYFKLSTPPPYFAFLEASLFLFEFFNSLLDLFSINFHLVLMTLVRLLVEYISVDQNKEKDVFYFFIFYLFQVFTFR
jgi:hypothetical protein